MADPSYTAAKPGEFFCPRGGTWYACETGTKFVGCCAADPCKNGCFGDILRPAGRSTALANLSPGGSCGGQTPMWTCEMAPTFWGCCNEDPCMNNSTCPPGKLEPAFWDRPDQYYYFHDLNVALSSTVPEPTAFSTASSTTSTASSTSSTTGSTPTTTAAASSGKVSGAVIGGAVGGSLAPLIIIAAVVFILCRRKRRNKKESPRKAEEAHTSVTQKAELASPATSAGFSPPPTYSWNAAGHHSHQEWAHYQHNPQEMPEENRRSELFSPANGPAELHGGTAAGELESPENTPKPTHGEFDHDATKQQVHGLGVAVEDRSRKP